MENKFDKYVATGGQSSRPFGQFKVPYPKWERLYRVFLPKRNNRRFSIARGFVLPAKITAPMTERRSGTSRAALNYGKGQ